MSLSLVYVFCNGMSLTDASHHQDYLEVEDPLRKEKRDCWQFPEKGKHNSAEESLYLQAWSDNGDLKLFIKWQRTGSHLSIVLQTGMACKTDLESLNTSHWALGILMKDLVPSWLRRVAHSCPAASSPHPRTPPLAQVLKSGSFKIWEPKSFAEVSIYP